MRRRQRAAIAFVFLAIGAGCSLFTDLDGLSGRPSSSGDDGGGTSDGAITGDGNVGPGGDGGVGIEGGPGPFVRRALVLVGGDSNDGGVGGGTNALETVTTALLYEDGGLGPWKESPLKDVGYLHHLIAGVGSSVYVLRQPTPFIGTFDPNGAPQWTVSGGFPPRWEYCVAGSGDAVFLIGGKNDSGGFSKDINMGVAASPNPLAWTTSTAFPVERNFVGCAANEKFVYAGGGKNTAGMHQDGVYYAARVATGVGEWKQTSPLPSPCYWPRFVVAANRLFVVGAEFDTVDRRSVYSAAIQADGSLGGWQIGTRIPDERYGLGVSANGNRIYISGGGYDIAYSQVYTASVDPATGAMTTWALTTPLLTARQNHGSAFVNLP